MSGWRIVPVEATKEQLRAVLLSPFGEAGRQYKAAVAAAPEPDWEALANVAFDAEAEAFAECVANGTVMQHGQHYARRISILAALKATFGGAK